MLLAVSTFATTSALPWSFDSHRTKPGFVQICGALHLVDLAGSERVKESGVVGERLKETRHINKSLSALGGYGVTM